MTPNRVRLSGDLYHPKVPAGATNITRPSRWGNPFSITVHGLDESLRLYREHLRAHPELVDRARVELHGQDLACWCRPGQPCHGDTLLAVVAGEEP